MPQEQIDIWRFRKGQNQGLNTYVKTVTLQTQKKSLIIPQRDGCASCILKRQTIPTATFQGVTYIIEPPWGDSPNRRITLNGNGRLPSHDDWLTDRQGLRTASLF